MKFEQHSINCGAGDRLLRVYAPDQTERGYYRGKRPAVVIFPGGAYAFTFEGEAEPIALAFAAAGVCAFVLDYSTTGNSEKVFPYAQLEAFAAIRFAREHAEEYGIDAHNIASLGFSAGGHLCGSTGVLWNKPILAEYLGEDAAASRPDKLVLCYPVLRAFAPCHFGSFQNLLGAEQPDEAMLEQLSLEKQVDDETPPAYIWATSEDTAVPIQSSLDFARALADHNTHCELHIYPHGGHGLCLANHVTEAHDFFGRQYPAAWVEGAVRFLFDEQVTQKIR